MLGLSFFIYGCNNRFALYTHWLGADSQQSSICCFFGSGRKTKRRGLHVTGVKMTPSVYIYYILFILQCQIIRKASRGRNYH